MSFLYPLGLLGLIGIPILILIYIIKNKYVEQTVSSTYLWTLSERFLKKRNPFSRLTGIIALILQLLAVLVLSLALAHPVFTFPGAAKEYCFILDASGSMNITDENGKTRFESAKEQIADVINDSVNGSVYSLICVGDTVNVVFERNDSREQALLLLGEAQPTHSSLIPEDALAVAQEYFRNNSGILTYLATDRDYENTENIQLMKVAGYGRNRAISDVSYEFTGSSLLVSGTVTSYEVDGEVTICLFLNGSDTAAADVTVTATADTPVSFILEAEITDFSSFRVALEGEDSLAADDSCEIFNLLSESVYRTLLISDRPFFLQSLLSSVGYSRTDVIGAKEYNGQTGYGLYIFDSAVPETLPEDGTVWLVNPTESVPNSGFSVQERDIEPENGVELVMTTSSASTVRTLIKDVSGNDIYVRRYSKCGLYRSFYTLLSYNGNPLLFAGRTVTGNREVVFAFDLHASNLPLLLDSLVLARNLLEYSFPDVLTESLYQCGDTVEINLLSGCDTLRVDSPLGGVAYLDTGNAVCEYTLTEAGVYTVTMTVSGAPKTFHIYSMFAPEESDPVIAGAQMNLEGSAGTGGLDGVFDNLLPLFIIILVLVIADWGVYCYEKYQLR